MKIFKYPKYPKFIQNMTRKHENADLKKEMELKEEFGSCAKLGCLPRFQESLGVLMSI